MNLINLTFKPKLREFFGFSVIHSVTFSGDFLKDTLDLNGTGILPNGEKKTLYGTTLKLSDNSSYIELAMGKIRAQVEYKEPHHVEYTLNFLEERTEIIFKYINLQEQPCKNSKLGEKF